MNQFQTPLASFALAVALAVALLAGAAVANAQTPAAPAATNLPAFKGAVGSANLPPAPPGLVWNRLREVDVGVLTPPTWKKLESSLPNGKVFGWTDQALDAKGSFDQGLLVRVIWPDAGTQDNEIAAEATLDLLGRNLEGDPANTLVLESNANRKGDKIVAIMRVRNQLEGKPAQIAQSLMVAAPKSGVVYQFIFLANEDKWEERYKYGATMLNSIFIQAPGE
jgi:hypothetical protein